jgi:hypothetical protein
MGKGQWREIRPAKTAQIKSVINSGVGVATGVETLNGPNDFTVNPPLE